MSTKDSAKIHITAFCEPVISGGSPSLSISRERSSSVQGTIIFSGWPLIRRAYHRTKAIDVAVSTIHIRNRRTMPFPRSIPAASDATPVANGLTVDAMVPVPAPTRMTTAPNMRSYPRATNIGTIRA